MAQFIRVLILGSFIAGALYARVLAAPFSAAAPQETQAAVATAPALSDSEMEAFLTTAKILSAKDAGVGVTNSRRATLSNGEVTHDAHIQVVDEARPVFQAGAHTELNFKDTYRYNIAAFRIARLVGLSNVPMSVARRIDGKNAAITWWVDDVKMDEKERLAQKTAGPNPDRTSKQIAIMRVFDELIQNKDRNQGNILWTGDWKMWLIDHTRAFRTGNKLMNAKTLTRVERGFLERLRALDGAQVEAALKGYASSSEIKAIMQRRDAIVKHFDERVAKLGEAAVLFTEPSAPAP